VGSTQAVMVDAPSEGRKAITILPKQIKIKILEF